MRFAVRLYFQTPLHIGSHGLGMEKVDTCLHSDTLYSILYLNWVAQFGEEPEELPLLLTSAFPFVGDTYFLPKPVMSPQGFAQTDAQLDAKLLKSVGYVSYEVFTQWVGGLPLSLEKVKEDFNLLNKAVSITVRPRVSLDRITQRSMLYFVGEMHFARDVAGLYFVVECDQGAKARLFSILSDLQDVGVGGDRSAGYGKFRFVVDDSFTLDHVATNGLFVTLSLFHPGSPEEIHGALGSYNLTTRGGWSLRTGAPFRTKKVVMFSEGSAFTKEVRGHILDVSPQPHVHVYRDGRAFLVGGKQS